MQPIERFLNTGCITSNMVFKEGNIPWNKELKGIHLSPKSEFTTERTIGKNNVNWKGKEVGYWGLHMWIRRHKSKLENCEKCNKKGYLHLANISKEYKRDINDYKWLCVSCHAKYDKKGLNRKINIFFEDNFSRLSKELKNNILNGIKLYGYLKVF